MYKSWLEGVFVAKKRIFLVDLVANLGIYLNIGEVWRRSLEKKSGEESLDVWVQYVGRIDGSPRIGIN